MGQDSAWLTMNIKKTDFEKFDKVLREGDEWTWWEDLSDNDDGTLWAYVGEAWGGWEKELKKMAAAGLTFYGERGHGDTSEINAIVFACFQGDLVIANTLGDDSWPAVAVDFDGQIKPREMEKATQYWRTREKIERYLF